MRALNLTRARVGGLAATLLIGVLPRAAAAQMTHADSVHLRERCRFASQIVSTGHPAPHERWAVYFAPNCGTEGAAALARAFARLGGEADTTALQPFVRAAVNWRDAAVGQAAQTLAANESATAPARAYALYVLLRYRAPQFVADYADLTSVGEGEICGLGRIDHEFQAEGTPLPAGFQDATLALADRIVADAGQPAPVRSAAICVQDAFRRSRAVGR